MSSWIKSRWRALVLGAGALASSVNLWLNWLEERERQAQVAQFIETLPIAESARVAALTAHSPVSLIVMALLTGFLIALALAHWSGNQR